MKKEADEKAAAKEVADKAKVKAEEEQTKAELDETAKKKKAEEEEAAKAASAKEQAVALSKQAEAAAALLPANTAYGKVREHKGFLRIEQSPEHEQNAFIKFPMSTIKADDAIASAKLRVFKVGGSEGPAIVKLSSCAWSRDSITFTNSQKAAGKIVSVGNSANFPALNDDWVTIELNKDEIQSARGGEHICFQISGGPSESPVVIASELAGDKQPQLSLQVQMNTQNKEEEAVLRDSNDAQGTVVHQLDDGNVKYYELTMM